MVKRPIPAQDEPPQLSGDLFMLFIYFLGWLLFLGPLSVYAISELLFYLFQERALIKIEAIRCLGCPDPRDLLVLRIVYWICVLVYVLPSHI